MTAIDFLIIGSVGYAFWSFLKQSRAVAATPAAARPTLLLTGLAVTALIFVTDLLIMHVFPLFMSSSEAMATMEFRYHQYLWIALLFGIFLISAGFTVTCKAMFEYIRELHDVEDRYAFAAAGTNDGLWDWNIKTGDCCYSVRWKKTLGYRDGELKDVRETFISLLHPDDRACAATAWEAHLTNRVPYDLEYRLKHKDGHYIWVWAKGQAIWDLHGEAVRMGGSISDITERKKIVESLKNSEDRFRDFAESAADWFWEMDADLRFTYMSPNAERVTGVPPAAYYGKTRKELFDDGQDPDNWDKHLRIIKAHKPFRDFTYLIGGEGIEPKWLRASGRPIFDADGAFLGYRGIGSDVSDSMRREIALRDSERNLRDILKNSPTGIAIVAYSRANGHVEGKRLFANDALVEMFGATSSRALIEAKVAGSWAISNQLRVFNENMEKGIDLRDYQVQRRRGDGATLWVSMNTRPVHFDNQDCTMIWYFDITERKRTADALKESEERFKAVVEHSPAATSLKDTDGRYLIMNKTFQEWSNLGPGNFIGKTVYDLFPKDFADRVYAQDQFVMNSGIAQTTEEQLIVSGGRKRQIWAHKFPIYGPDGICAGVGTASLDVTEQRDTENQLRQAQKMEAVGQLTGGIAHDFNNMLGIIIGNLDFLTEELKGNADLLALTNAATRAALSGAALNRQLLAFSRQLPLSPQIIDLNDTLSSMRAMLQRIVGKAIKVKTTKSKGLWAVDADPAKLESALVNLATNARDAMPDGGKLTINTTNVRLDEDFTVAQSGVTPGEYVMLAITDTGAGMTPQTVEHAFEPFFTTKTVGKGTGLGLSMVFGFAKQSGGHVAIYSKEGKGTTVQLYLPRAQRTAEMAIE
jgi:PAS domain S-box-containing protein